MKKVQALFSLKMHETDAMWVVSYKGLEPFHTNDCYYKIVRTRTSFVYKIISFFKHIQYTLLIDFLNNNKNLSGNINTIKLPLTFKSISFVTYISYIYEFVRFMCIIFLNAQLLFKDVSMVEVSM